jgi:hypothetical protein
MLISLFLFKDLAKNSKIREFIISIGLHGSIYADSIEGTGNKALSAKF